MLNFKRHSIIVHFEETGRKLHIKYFSIAIEYCAHVELNSCDWSTFDTGPLSDAWSLTFFDITLSFQSWNPKVNSEGSEECENILLILEKKTSEK